MSEQSATQTIRSHLARAGAHIQRIEDKLTPGVPDMNFKIPDLPECWLEGKFLRSLPKRDATPVRVGLKTEQALWLEERKLRGGKVFVWVRILDTGWWLFDDRFRELQDGIPTSQFVAEAYFQNAKELVEALLTQLVDK